MGCMRRKDASLPETVRNHAPSLTEVRLEKNAPHSRYFSDELGALFIYNNIEHMFTCLVTYGIISIWKVKCNTKFQNA